MEIPILLAIIGFIITPYTAFLGRVQVRVNKLQDKIEEVYTKGETKEMVELMTDPLKETTVSLIASQDKLIDAIHKLELVMARNEG